MSHVKIKKLRKIAKKSSGVKKLKTNSSAKSRFKITSGGKLITTQACKRHNMIKHSRRQKKSQAGVTVVGNTLARVCKKFFRLPINLG